jgi:outer membrane protein W
VTANYHFQLEDNEKFDPFLGLGLGYQIISCDYDGIGSDICSNSALYFIGRVGARYFLNEKFAAYADAGAGGATVNVGVTLRLQ